MTARTSRREIRRFRLATNDNETIVSMNRTPSFPRIAGEDDVEGHRLATNDNETVVSMNRTQPFPRVAGDDDASSPEGPARR